MSQTNKYIKRLSELHEGELSRLRRLAGQPLDSKLSGFDLFTGLWWPLRAESPATPRRDPSWLVAKLFGAFKIPHVRPAIGSGPALPEILGRYEPNDEFDCKRYLARFDTLLCSPLSSLEPHLRWALSSILKAKREEKYIVPGLDWAQLLDDLSIWDRGEAHRYKRDIRDIWAEKYIISRNAQKGGLKNAN